MFACLLFFISFFFSILSVCIGLWSILIVYIPFSLCMYPYSNLYNFIVKSIDFNFYRKIKIKMKLSIWMSIKLKICYNIMQFIICRFNTDTYPHSSAKKAEENIKRKTENSNCRRLQNLLFFNMFSLFFVIFIENFFTFHTSITIGINVSWSDIFFLIILRFSWCF